MWPFAFFLSSEAKIWKLYCRIIFSTNWAGFWKPSGKAMFWEKPFSQVAGCNHRESCLSHKEKLPDPVKVAGDLWYLCPRNPRSCPRESKLLLRKLFTECKLLLRSLEALWGSGSLTPQGRSDSTLDFRSYKLNPIFNCFSYEYAFVLLLASKTNLFKLGSSLKKTHTFSIFLLVDTSYNLQNSHRAYRHFNHTLKNEIGFKHRLLKSCVYTGLHICVLNEMNSCQKKAYYLFLTLTWAIMNTVTKED